MSKIEDKKRILRKSYSTKDGKFYVRYSKARVKYESFVEQFDNFKAFCEFLNFDLSDANLIGYTLTDEDVKLADLSNALIDTEQMIKYNISFEDKTNKITSSLYNINYYNMNCDLLPMPTKPQYYDDDYNNNQFVYYISDLHLDYKLSKKFQNKPISNTDIMLYIEEVVKNIKNSTLNHHGSSTLLIVGDISFNFEIVDMFFSKLKSNFMGSIIYILGNHELWSDEFRNKKKYSLIIDAYKKLTKKYYIHLLENELYINFVPPNENYVHFKILSEQEILSLTKEKANELFNSMKFGVFGSLGYAGLNEEINADASIYQTKAIDRKLEIALSKKVSLLHDKLTEIVPKYKKIIFATHMPREDWTNSQYTPNFFYINGHNHQNLLIDDENIHRYSDNQIGYYNDNIYLKHIHFNNRINIFESYEDGVHKITAEDYNRFYSGIHEYMVFQRDYYKLYLVKHDSYYCFLYENEKHKLFVLNGGTPKHTKKHTLEYYYDMLPIYGKKLKQIIAKYQDYLMLISSEVKSIGGDGKIHGCIIDLTYFEHIFVNPFDGKLSFYTAESKSDKWLYDNYVSLLKNECPKLFENYNNKSIANNNLPQLYANLEINDEKIYYDDCHIYSISDMIKRLQFTYKYNVIREWNDNILDVVNVNAIISDVKYLEDNDEY